MRTMAKREKESQANRESEGHRGLLCLYESMYQRVDYTMGDDACTRSYELYIADLRTNNFTLFSKYSKYLYY